MKISILPESFNRVSPNFTEINRDDESFVMRLQCQDVKNFVFQNGRMKSATGTQRVFPSPSGQRVRWGARYYGRRGDESFIKKLFYYGNDGQIYEVDEVADTATSRYAGLNANVWPTNEIFQVAGNSVMYVFNGEDYPIYYEGNDSATFYEVNTTYCPYKFSQGIEFLDRMFAFEKSTSVLHVSKNLEPDNFVDSSDSFAFSVGKDKDSHITGLALLGGELFIFKSNSIYRLFGRTPDEWQIRLVTKKFGLASLRALAQIGGALVFLNSYDYEWYQFSGTEPSIQDLTAQEIDFSSLFDPVRLKDIVITEFDGLCRIAFKKRDGQGDFNNSELVFPTKEIGHKGLVRWSYLEGAKISYYIKKDQQDDNRELITGRSEEGVLMYHRGNNYDDEAMEKMVRFLDIVPHMSTNAVFSSFWVMGKANGDNTVAFKHFPDALISDRGEVLYNQKGEQRVLGFIKQEMMTRFNTRIIPITSHRKGHAMGIEIYDNSLNKDIEIYRLATEFTVDDIVRSELRGA